MRGVAVAMAVFLAIIPLAVEAEPGTQIPASTQEDLHFHLADFTDFQVNTQPIPPGYVAPSSTGGYASATTSCLPALPGASLVGQEFHSYYGYGAPALVDYNTPTENGRPRFAAQRGLASDVQIDPTQPWTVHWYFATQAAPEDAASKVPVVVPNVVVAATVRTGDAISIDHQSFAAGDLVASGRTAPMTLAPNSANHESVSGVDVYRFDIPMTIAVPLIPKATGYQVRIDAYVDNPLCNDANTGTVMPNTVRPYADSTHAPGMRLNILNPIQFYSLTPRFVGDSFVVSATFATPWGFYDTPKDAATLAITGPTLPVEVTPVQAPAYHVHGESRLPGTATWVWNHTADHAATGDYEGTLTVTNLAGTLKAVTTFAFNLGKGTVTTCIPAASGNTTANSCETTVQSDGIRQVTPGLGLPALALAVSGLAAAAWRRKAA